MTSRNPNAHGKALESGENSRAKGNPDARRILSSREGRGQQSHTPALSPGTPAHSGEPNPVPETDEAALVCFYTKRTLCEHLRISIRSWDRAAAAGLTPAPDLICGARARWSPQTIERWLKLHPVLPGRGKRS